MVREMKMETLELAKGIQRARLIGIQAPCHHQEALRTVDHTAE